MNTSRSLWVSILIVFSLSGIQAQTATSRIVSSAKSLLSTLDQKQRASVLFAFEDEEQRARWSNLPISIVRRAGLSMGELSATQRAAAFSLVSAALSQKGFEKVQQIMEGDEILKTNAGNGPPNGKGGDKAGGKGGGKGSGPMFGKDLYYIAILGTPSEKTPWTLQFGGHHLALNITIAGERGILTPSLTGAQPALYTINGKAVRPLGQESDKGVALLNALDDNQRKQAILSYRVSDLVLGPGQDGKTIQPEGLKASNMNEKQRTMLLDVIAEWGGHRSRQRRCDTHGGD